MIHRIGQSLIAIGAGVLVALMGGPASAMDVLEDLSLEDIAKTEISSVSRRNQPLANVPAAAFVISAEDIHRSGAHTLPDVLRMVPGIEVAQIDNGRFAVTARGFNGRFANKLQVLVDGRSLYSPLFSGVIWEDDPVALDDIERIEVIRGPGAAMWGANAVNGVINIITRHSSVQVGGHASVTLGTNGNTDLYVRRGISAGEDTSWRLSARARHADPSTRYASGTESEDRLDNGQLNLRFDRNLGNGSDLSIWANANATQLGDIAPVLPVLTNPATLGLTKLKQSEDSQSITARYRWMSGAIESSIQFAASRAHIEMKDWFREDHSTYDLDYQGRYTFGAHDILWGISHRHNDSEIDSSPAVFTPTDPSFTQRLSSFFIHDNWTLVPESLQLAFGARWEKSSAIGTTVAPSASLLWTPTRADTLWFKLARAPRIPSQGEQQIQAITRVLPPIPPLALPILIRSNPPPEGLDPEFMSSIEVGYRKQFSPYFNANITTYRQRYADRISSRRGDIDFMRFWPIFLVQDVVLCNCSGGWIDGVELAADWLVTPNWRLQLSLTTTRLDMNRATSPEAALDNAQLEKMTPRHHGGLRSQWNFAANQQLDLWLRGSASYVLTNAPYTNSVRVPGYLTLDLRYAYRINKDMEFSVTGRNLIGARRFEFVADNIPSLPVEIKPALLVGLHWNF